MDEPLADARVLRNWGDAAVEQVDKYVTTHSEASEEKQRKKKRSKDRKNQVPVHFDLFDPITVYKRSRRKTSQGAKKGKKRT